MMTSLFHRTETPADDAWKGHTIWIFSDTVAGAKASANLYSLIQTARRNELNPYLYLKHVFTELPRAQSVGDVEALLPAACDRDALLRLA